MTFSKPLLGTNNNKVKLSWIEYIWFSCILQGWHNCWYSFQNWKDLMTGNWQYYTLLDDDDPFECCSSYFWGSLEEEIYSKEFLESLMQMAEDVKTGKVETVPYTKEMFDKLFDLVGDQIDTPESGTQDPEDE